MQRIGKPEPSDDIRLIFIIENFGCSRDNLFFFWRGYTSYLQISIRALTLNVNILKYSKNMFIFVLCQGRGQYIIRKGAIFFLQLTGTYTQAGDWKAKFPTLITLFTNMTISTLLIVTVCACKTRTQHVLGLSRSLCCSSVLQHWSRIYKRLGSTEGGGTDSYLSHDLTNKKAPLKFMILKLNREVLGQVPSIYHLVNFGL